MKNIHKILTTIAIITALISGCRSTQEYENLADAGNKYAEVVDELLIADANLITNRTSEELLEQRTNSPNITINDYHQKDDPNKKNIGVIIELLNRNKLLKNYFSDIQELASSNTGEAVEGDLNNITNELQQSSAKLQLTPEIGNVMSTVPPISGLVIDARINGILRRRLENDAPTIIKQLELQHKLIDYLCRIAQSAIDDIERLQEYRLVIQPLVDSNLIPANAQDAWIKKRQQILLMEMEKEEIKDADQTLGKFQDTFKAAVQGHLAPLQLQDLLKELNSTLKLQVLTTNQ